MGRNKYRIAAGIGFASILALGACDSGDEVTEHVGDELPTPAETPEEADPGGGVDEAGGVAFGFTDLEVEAVLAEGGDFYASYEEERDDVTAEYQNAAEEVDVEGNDAWDAIEPAIQELEIDPEMTDEEVLAAVAEAFGIDGAYESLSVSVTYEDGTEEEYEAEL
ncbi:YusW family protein [Indiicoccus explosivorum]|uniref:YusW family protein n=1 Tax=Indiicoccus explosivorum TaxID=1917864 RepID=UPI000B43DEB9|nr:YusW family protein [Indiicoccus explosivorum]